ncbi:AB-hydrolase YheT [Patellaria atrata CBS 101060]|uniref:alcohol O-acetyltransferase n=1 Tax=Patellaria atrata CBS 101060 TaxID=1346257 RepID=A0A9P4S6K3_9PEZI|nr:AB-hydrolase YheT [Patellaria atrata CBS 101060]
MSSWLGYAKTSFHHAPKTITLTTSSGSEIPLSELCKDATPPCRLNPLLFNGHLQTFWTAYKGYDIPIVYRRKIFEAEDPAVAGTFAVDFVSRIPGEKDESLPPRTSYFTDQEFGEYGSSDSKPMLVTLHGLSGGSYEMYLRAVLAPLVTEDNGWEACVVNARGCAMAKISTPIMFNARATWDIKQVVEWLRKKFPNRPLFGLGFSLGANILTRYVAEEGSNCLFKAAVVCSNPWNLDISDQFLRNSFIGNQIYERVMGNNVKHLANLNAEQICKVPGIDMEGIERIKHLYDFDREIQIKVWGYPSTGAYYRDASSCDAVIAVKVPFFAINALDDPIAVQPGIPFDEIKTNPYTVLCTTTLGGHLSWFEVGGGRWFAKPVSQKGPCKSCIPLTTLGCQLSE